MGVENKIKLKETLATITKCSFYFENATFGKVYRSLYFAYVYWGSCNNRNQSDIIIQRLFIR